MRWSVAILTLSFGCFTEARALPITPKFGCDPVFHLKVATRFLRLPNLDRDLRTFLRERLVPYLGPDFIDTEFLAREQCFVQGGCLTLASQRSQHQLIIQMETLPADWMPWVGFDGQRTRVLHIPRSYDWDAEEDLGRGILAALLYGYPLADARVRSEYGEWTERANFQRTRRFQALIRWVEQAGESPRGADEQYPVQERELYRQIREALENPERAMLDLFAAIHVHQGRAATPLTDSQIRILQQAVSVAVVQDPLIDQVLEFARTETHALRSNQAGLEESLYRQVRRRHRVGQGRLFLARAQARLEQVQAGPIASRLSSDSARFFLESVGAIPEPTVSRQLMHWILRHGDGPRHHAETFLPGEEALKTAIRRARRDSAVLLAEFAEEMTINQAGPLEDRLNSDELRIAREILSGQPRRITRDPVPAQVVEWFRTHESGPPSSYSREDSEGYAFYQRLRWRILNRPELLQAQVEEEIRRVEAAPNHRWLTARVKARIRSAAHIPE